MKQPSIASEEVRGHEFDPAPMRLLLLKPFNFFNVCILFTFSEINIYC
ncbi:hypothetical protein HanIR_Chr14g0672461 [Helianthus annuus]|nr:hypothetical protein HanIR_Chr14g0672461 [Helianthus annuus]